MNRLTANAGIAVTGQWQRIIKILRIPESVKPGFENVIANATANDEKKTKSIYCSSFSWSISFCHNLNFYSR
jgi:hypothetical protein